VEHAALLLLSGKTEKAHLAAIKLTSLKDGNSLYNAACLFSKLGDKAEALITFRKALEMGFNDSRLLKDFLLDDLTALAGTPEYEEVRGMVEKIEAGGPIG
jgi:hypothetical protein